MDVFIGQHKERPINTCTRQFPNWIWEIFSSRKYGLNESLLEWLSLKTESYYWLTPNFDHACRIIYTVAAQEPSSVQHNKDLAYISVHSDGYCLLPYSLGTAFQRFEHSTSNSTRRLHWFAACAYFALVLVLQYAFVSNKRGSQL